jgi:hypothetical protein
MVVRDVEMVEGLKAFKALETASEASVGAGVVAASMIVYAWA